MKNLPAVITPADRPATLGIARSLGRRGIPVHGVDVDPLAIGMVSKYVRPHPLPNSDDSDENRLQHLIDLGKMLGKKAVLYPVSDDDVLLCSRERQVLGEYYLFVMPEHETIADLVTKDGLYRLAKRCQVSTPEVFQPCDETELRALAEVLSYPVILKPILSTSWQKPEIVSMLRDGPLSNPPKVAFCPDSASLLLAYQKIAAYDSHLVVQEVIGGEDERLAYYCFYLDRSSRPLAAFAGRKLRILPVGFGSATYVRSIRDPALEEVALRLLSGVRYQGLGGVEFKKDPSDGQYKLIEFNARFGLWDTLSIKCGIDIPYIAYCDALGQPVPAQFEYRENVTWLDMQRDLRAFLIYRQRQELHLAEWLRTVRGEKEWSTYARDDWKPSAVAAYKLLERPWSVVKGRVLADLRRPFTDRAQGMRKHRTQEWEGKRR